MPLSKKRIAWVDWMKALAMYFIIAGHCWVPGNKYIYVFSVPCFFIISGYLSHKEERDKVFCKKLLWNMVVPMGIYLVINLCFYNLQMYVNGLFNWSNLYKGPLFSLIGMQGQNYSAGGLQALWFVYTLCICKIIFQFLPTKNKWPAILLTLLFLAVSVILNSQKLFFFNSFVNVLIAFPFFNLGFILRKYSKELNNSNVLKDIVVFILAVIITFLCGKFNGIVFLYKCSYGNNLLLCLLGGLAGTAMVYIISKWCAKWFCNFKINVIGGVL